MNSFVQASFIDIKYTERTISKIVIPAVLLLMIFHCVTESLRATLYMMYKLTWAAVGRAGAAVKTQKEKRHEMGMRSADVTVVKCMCIDQWHAISFKHVYKVYHRELLDICNNNLWPSVHIIKCKQAKQKINVTVRIIHLNECVFFFCSCHSLWQVHNICLKL